MKTYKKEGLNTPARRKILVADDDPAILDAVKMMLEFCNYEVCTAQDGRFEPKLKDHKPQLVLLDIWLSGTDGREVCRKLKSKKETKDIPIILISASRDVEESSKEAGANDFLPKPFEMNDLLNKIEKYITN